MDIKKKAFWRRRVAQDVIRRNDGTHPSSSGYFAAPSFRTEQADFFFPIRFLLAPEVFAGGMGRPAQREISLRSSIQRKPPNHSERTARHLRNSSRHPGGSGQRDFTISTLGVARRSARSWTTCTPIRRRTNWMGCPPYPPFQIRERFF